MFPAEFENDFEHDKKEITGNNSDFSTVASR